MASATKELALPLASETREEGKRRGRSTKRLQTDSLLGKASTWRG